MKLKKGDKVHIRRASGATIRALKLHADPDDMTHYLLFQEKVGRVVKVRHSFDPPIYRVLVDGLGEESFWRTDLRIVNAKASEEVSDDSNR